MNRYLQQILELAGQHPFDDVFVAKIQKRIIYRASQVPVHVHKRFQGQERIEQATKEAIVEVYHEEFPDAWFPIVVKANWPYANCVIKGNKALIEYSFSPETDALMGGIELEPVEISIQRAPNIISRAAKAIMDRKKGDDRQPEFAPTGRPDKVSAQAQPTPQPIAKPRPASTQAAPKPAPKRPPTRRP